MENASEIAALLGLAGALWWALLSLGATYVYAPVGVSPGELGLNAGTVLAQSAIGLLATLVVTGLLGLLGLLLTPRPTRRPAHGQRRVITMLGRAARPAQVLLIALSIFILVLTAAAAARSGILDGRQVPWANPWRASTVTITWTAAPPPRAPALPRCALYLGRADGISVFYDADADRTLRVPTDSVYLSHSRSRTSCP